MNARALTAVVIATLILGCQPPPASEQASQIEPMRGFSWVVDDQLAAMPRPGSSRELTEDLAYVSDQGIATLVSLTITPIDSEHLAAHGLDGHHIPVEDFTAPTLEQMIEFVDLVRAHDEAGELLGVHCTGGLGRSGTMAAANFVALGFAAADAIDEIRRLRPGSIETASQEQAIFDFAANLAGD